MADNAHSAPQGANASPFGINAPPAALMRLLGRFERSELEGFIAVAIEVADFLDGDPEAEELPGEDAFLKHDPIWADSDSDGKDASWPEWHTRRRHKLVKGASEMAGGSEWAGLAIFEDTEEDDPDTGIEDSPEGFDPETDMAVDDIGCDGDSDMEIEQMAQDVPMLSVVTVDHNIFTDQRQPLGLSNLQSSYRTNGCEVRSADSGAVHVSRSAEPKPGVPV